MSDLPPKKTPDPMEEWRNPKPSKWPNRIRLLFLPFIGALIYSMV
jgi:coproporphyrinogen III oxidase